MTTVIPFRDERFGPKPETPLEALKQARALLAEEGHWVQGTEFRRTDDKPLDPQAPLCGSWGVCAIGAVGMVAGCMTANKFPRVLGGSSWYAAIDESDPVYKEAVKLLDRTVEGLTYTYEGFMGSEQAEYDGIVEYNDDSGRTRDEVLAKFDEAIALAEQEVLV